MSSATTTTVTRKDLSFLSQDTYNNPGNGIKPEQVNEKGYSIEYRGSNTETGFKYTVYQKTGTDEYVIAYAGTDDSNDFLHADLDIFRGISTAQESQALQAYNALRQEHPEAHITLTGQSLGGALAQIVGIYSGEQTVTFNSLDVKNYIEIDPNKDYSNISNYSLATDPVNLLNLGSVNPCIGNNYIIPVDDHDFIGSHNNFDKLGTGTPVLFGDWLYEHGGEFVSDLETLWGKIEDAFGSVGGALGAIGGLAGKGLGAIGFFGSMLAGLTGGASSGGFGSGMSLGSAIGFFNDNFGSIWDNLNACIQKSGGKIPSLPHLLFGALAGLVPPSLYDTLFSQAQGQYDYPTFLDPLIFDLNGDGIQTTSSEQGRYFDLDNDGFAQKMSFASVNDALLALDRNNNGVDLIV